MRYRRPFEAHLVMGACTAGSAALHPRLLIGRPLRGRSCCGGPISRGGKDGHEAGCPPRRDAIHRVSPARGKAPPRHSPPRAGHPGRERRDESRLYAGNIPATGAGAPYTETHQGARPWWGRAPWWMVDAACWKRISAARGYTGRRRMSGVMSSSPPGVTR